MFEETSFHRPQVLPIGNYLKGGDFMGLEDGVSRMIWEGSPVPGCDPTVKNSRFPEVVGRTKQPIPTALEIAATRDEAGRPAIDPVTLKSVTSMEGGE